MNLFSAEPDALPGSRGEIIVSPPSPALDCRVLNLSAVGATLLVPAGTRVPDAITLAIAGEFVMRRGRVVWRRPGRVGVAFEMPV
ncbi:PilZ domain-containing protein [Methylobacterium terricola]|uniref:PilZ domain-containing protein n=1 Tax=Methylobacterium terricola TaxID=2583531 RepID=A0A5C4LLY1_9HYPH|nr:PilZ domain-containing protein [Methylobacterium terricola]TNC13492.1 PilZ domain-containing protein [Methylobacterium terricola]